MMGDPNTYRRRYDDYRLRINLLWVLFHLNVIVQSSRERAVDTAQQQVFHERRGHPLA